MDQRLELKIFDAARAWDIGSGLFHAYVRTSQDFGVEGFSLGLEDLGIRVWEDSGLSRDDTSMQGTRIFHPALQENCAGPSFGDPH